MLERLINYPENRNFHSKKFAQFCGFEGSFFTILEVKKVVFGTFSKLRSLVSLWALFLDYKGPLLVVFSARKVDK